MNRIRRHPFTQALVLTMLMPMFAWLPVGAYANPNGGKVVAGSAEILSPDGLNQTINQFSNRAVIEWQNFSIDSGEVTRFVQPGSGAIALNRVLGSDPSTINGALQANGSVYLINQNGVFIGPNGTVDVAGFLASTLDTSNSAFMNGGDLRFTGDSLAEVQNLGKINAAGGDVIFMGHTVRNDGVIGAVDGTVAMAGGSDVLLKAFGDQKVFVSGGSGGTVTNTGEITGSMVELRAHGNAYALAIKNDGAVRATGVEHKNGRVILSANQGDIETTGTIEAQNFDGSGGEIIMSTGLGEIYVRNLVNASSLSGQGGEVRMLGDAVNLTNADVRADGDSGGSIQIGGAGASEINVANSNISANGRIGDGGSVSMSAGDVVIYGDSTLGAVGEVNGGVISITGSDLVSSSGVLAADGNTGAGGQVMISSGGSATIGGEVSADGATNGGLVAISSGQTTIEGAMSADASGGTGGLVSIAGDDINVTSAGSITSSGTTGGMIRIQGGDTALIDGLVAADGDVGGNVQIDADTTTIGGSVSSLGGGDIAVTGDTVGLGEFAVIDASGINGGEVSIGGGFQGNDPFLRNANSTTIAAGSVIRAEGSSGLGGNVYVWADGSTSFAGNIVAPDGFVEVSGKDQLTYSGMVTAGRLLLDPTNVTLVNSATPAAGQVDVVALRNTLEAGTDTVIHTNYGPATGLGNILISADLRYGSNADLAFFANGSITANASVKNHGSGNISLVGGWDPTGAPSQFTGSPEGSSPATLSYDNIINGEFGTFAGAGGNINISTDGNNREVEVGSAGGETNLVGSNVILAVGNGNDDYTQVGYRRTRFDYTDNLGTQDVVVEGDINVWAASDVILAGERAGNRRHVMIGHGGRTWREDVGTARETLTTRAGNGDSFNVASILRDREILGYVENYAYGNDDLAAYITAGQNNQLYGTTETVNEQTNTDLQNIADAGTGTAFLTHLDNITPTTVTITASIGGNADSYSDINGDGVLYASDNTTVVGSIDYVTGEIELTSQISDVGDAEVIYQHGNVYDWDGDTLLWVERSDNWSGDISINAGDTVLLQGGNNDAFAQIGHGGLGAEITNNNLNNLGLEPFSGGFRRNWGGPVSVDLEGNIDINTQILVLSAGQNSDSWAMVGHGGRDMRGEKTGDINVVAPIFVGGLANTQDTGGARDFAQIGHGGFNTSDPWARPELPTVRQRVEVDNDGTRGFGGSVDLANDWALQEVYILGDIRAGAFISNNRQSVGRADITNPNFRWTDENYDLLGDNGLTAPTVIPELQQEYDRTWLLANGTGSNNLPGAGINLNPITGERIGNTGEINVTVAQGAVVFESGVNYSDWARIGHGGELSAGDHVGSINVIVPNEDILFRHDVDRDIVINGNNIRGRQINQIGHGGDRSPGSHTGEIYVESGGNILFEGAMDRSFAQIGHGGWNDHDAGTNNRDSAFAQGTLSGDITVLAAGDIDFRGGYSRGAYAYAQIGHGGYRNYANPFEGHNGNILVDSGGSITFMAGNPLKGSNGDNNYAMIGHGGVVSRGDHWGAIDVTAQDDITFIAMAGYDGYSNDTDGNGRDDLESGRIQPGYGGTADDSKRNALRDARNGANNFAQIGHGGISSTHRTNGDLRDQTGSDAVGFGVLGLLDGHVYGGATLAEGDPNRIESTINVNAVNGDVLFQAATHGQAMSAQTLQDIRDGTLSDAVLALNPVANHLHGHVNTINQGLTFEVRDRGFLDIAPWDPTMPFDPANLSAAAGGHNTLWNSNSTGTGPTQLNRVAYSGNFQLFDGTDPIDLNQNRNGSLDQTYDSNGLAREGVGVFPVMPEGHPLFGLEGTPIPWADSGYAQIGHGGRDSGLRANNAVITAAEAASGVDDPLLADIATDLGVSDIGGNRRVGHMGDINVTAGGDILMRGGDLEQIVYGETNTGASNDPTAHYNQYQPDHNYVQIGHGGDAARGAHAGNITVLAGGNFDLIAGKGHRNFAQVGHGGVDADLISGNGSSLGGDRQRRVTSGDISVIAGGGIRMHGAQDTLPWLTHSTSDDGTLAGNNAGLSLIVDDQGNITGTRDFDGQTDPGSRNDSNRYSYSQIGHGGGATEGVYYGNIYVEAGGGDDPLNPLGIDMQASDGTADGYVQVGHGGVFARADVPGSYGTRQSDITILSAGDIVMEAGEGRRQYAMVGHGGYDADLAPATSGNAGNNETYRSDHAVGDISVISTAGGVRLRGGDGDHMTDYHQQINTGDFDNDSNTPDTRFVGNDGDNNNNNSDELRDPEFNSGSFDSFAQIGHNGQSTKGSSTGNITVNAAADIEVLGGNGMSGYRNIDGEIHDGTSTGYANHSLLIFGRNSARIGHGGADDGDGTFTGSINLNAGGDITLRAGAFARSYAHVGHGGFNSDINLNNEEPLFSGDINVYSGGTILLEGSTGFDTFDVTEYLNFTQVGKFMGDPGRSEYSYAQIGHGGMELRDDRGVFIDGDITVTAVEDLILLGGTVERDAYAQIGHGGLSTEAEVSDSDIDVTVGGDLIMRRGSVRDGTLGIFTESAFIQPGLVRGFTAPTPTPVAGTEFSVANGNDEFAFLNQAGEIWEINDAYAKIGHGYQRLNVNYRNNNKVIGQNNQALTQERGVDAATIEGDIYVKIGDSAELQAALIGHTDTTSNGGSAVTTIGNTYIGISRNDLTAGGIIAADNLVDPFLTSGMTVFASGNDGFFFLPPSNEFRIYAPARENIAMMDGVVINGSDYDAPTSNEPLRPQEEQDGIPEFVYTYDPVTGEPIGDFTPEGVYPAVNGVFDPFFQIFYASFDASNIPSNPSGGGGGGDFTFIPPTTPDLPTVVGPIILPQPEIVLPPPPPGVRYRNIIELNPTGIDTFDDNEETLEQANLLTKGETERFGMGVQSDTGYDDEDEGEGEETANTDESDENSEGSAE